MGIRSVLVANRGEIAVRVIRACRELGLRSVAVYSDADADALHVRCADDAHRIGPAPAGRSYLDIKAVLAAAHAGGADAVHPGYGMLAENAEFAAAVRDAGLTFVGPSPDVIAMMGNKVAARDVARRCGVPVLPGSDGTVAGVDAAVAAADRIGYPVLVKASFAGGGRGMRVAADPEALRGAVSQSAREAVANVGRPDVHLERYIRRPRHVEVQVLADSRGAIVHLGDRDCSVQRRYQKLVEEAPAAGLSRNLRAALHAAAVRIAREIGYQGAGTVEFLVEPSAGLDDDRDGRFFFLEMNTRIQVEHGVTELVTGVDVVAAQLRIAADEPLDFGQDHVRVRGHAIQARLCAEDPWERFRPSPGSVAELRPPLGPWVRCDLGVETGDEVPSEYDSLLGKVLAWGPDRDTARRRLVHALGELRVSGVPTTAPYLRAVLDSPEFAANAHDTGSVERDWVPDPATRPAADPVPRPGAGSRDGVSVRRVRLATDRGPVEVAVYGRRSENGVTAPRRARGVGTAPAAPARTPSGDDAVAPMDATVVAVAVGEGEAVEPGTVLAVLETMKMEIEVRAERSGVVERVLFAPGEPVRAGSRLLVLGSGTARS